ncbi:MAG: hypothetical protein FWH26_11240 [Oscillospiraceae bacterium]|nr:hypothetical protein [Oscillospiraceae bacterium]
MNFKLQIDPAKKRQTMEGFGASGAWWAQVVGGWEHNREEIARLLFDKETGLGLSCYRYNMGGGSKRSGKGSFPNQNRRADSFDVSDTEYDWSRDAEALWILREAVRLGTDEIVFFVNSPPERFTVTGMAQAKIPFRANLRRGREADFTRYVLDVTEHFLAEGIPVRFVSPINEPFGPWIEKAGQEGCHYHPAGMRRLFRLFAEEMNKRPALKDVLLSGTENNDLRLMNKTYTRAVMNDPVIRARLDGVDVHGYVFQPLRSLKGVKPRFRAYMDKKYPGEKIRMSEWTEMRGGRDLSMTSALVQANVMWEDLTQLRAVSWQHWIAVSEVDYCDGLIYINEDDKTFEIPKRYYAFGNFSKFVGHGAVAVETTGDVPQGLRSLAFLQDGRTTVVFINNDEQAHTAALEGGAREAALYVTSDTQNLERQSVKTDAVSIPPRSVCTLVFGERA